PQRREPVGDVLDERGPPHGAGGLRRRGVVRDPQQVVGEAPHLVAVRRQSAASPCSPVRTRATSSTVTTHTFPSPILPVCAAPTTASMTAAESSSDTRTSMRTLGTRSTVYSAPR